MPDSLIRIQCMRCRTDIIFITDNGKIIEEDGFIFIEDAGEITIHCEKCNIAVTFKDTQKDTKKGGD